VIHVKCRKSFILVPGSEFLFKKQYYLGTKMMYRGDYVSIGAWEEEKESPYVVMSFPLKAILCPLNGKSFSSELCQLGPPIYGTRLACMVGCC
jgi:hypothetical protein